MSPTHPSICRDTKVTPDPDKRALTPSLPLCPQTGPAAWGRTRRGLPLPARHRLHPQEPALHQRLWLSARGLAARQPSCPACLQLSITLFSLSLSPCLHLSPHPTASCPCLSLTPGASAPSCSNVQGTAARPRGERFGLFFQGTTLPLIGGEAEGTGKERCARCARGEAAPAPPSQHVTGKWPPPVRPPSMLRAGASSSASSYGT